VVQGTNAAEEAKIQRRRAFVSLLMARGYSQREIKEQIDLSPQFENVSLATVNADCQFLRNQWRAEQFINIQDAAAQDLHRIDQMLKRLWPLAIDSERLAANDFAALREVRALIRERGDILGYREAVRFEIHQTGEEAKERPSNPILDRLQAAPELHAQVEDILDQLLSRQDRLLIERPASEVYLEELDEES